ncbi:MAG: tetratricopeptide repeat protein [Nanoarchaeota archaeon]|nr:tetratricopeptide repeat protein [Nanoarchaeota archaeon]
MTLEDQLMDDVRAGRDIDVERALLIASGCDTEEKVSEYMAKLDELEKRLDKYAPNWGNAEQTITNIHNLFWQRGHPYLEARAFEIGDAIDAKQAEEPVGNCAILSALYASLALRKGLEVQALVMPEHIALRVMNGDKPIDIETTKRGGFAWFGYSGIEGLAPIALISCMLNNRGNAKADQWRLEEAIEDYTKALEINPKHAGALNNRGVVRYKQGRLEEAIEDYTKALEINPKYAGALNNRGSAKYSQGRLEEAIKDYTKALEINPRQADALYNRSIARKELGDIKGAEEDFELYRKLEGESQ